MLVILLPCTIDAAAALRLILLLSLISRDERNVYMEVKPPLPRVSTGIPKIRVSSPY
jgi:hypothetical protein